MVPPMEGITRKGKPVVPPGMENINERFKQIFKGMNTDEEKPDDRKKDSGPNNTLLLLSGIGSIILIVGGLYVGYKYLEK